MMQSRTPQVPQNCRSATPPRRGFNLAELMFVIAAISGLTVLVMTVVGLLITAEQTAAEGLWIETTLSSFATDLREDAHRALDLEATWDEQGRTASVTFLLPGETRVSYGCTAEGVVRRQSGPEQREATETYRLALGASSFRLPGDNGLLEFTHLRTVPNVGGFGQPRPEAGGVQRTFHVQTAVGLHAGPAAEVTP